MINIIKVIYRFIDMNKPVRNERLRNEIDKREDRIRSLEVYATILEQHVCDDVKQITGKQVKDSDLAAKLIILGTDVTVNNPIFDVSSQVIIVHPSAKKVRISNPMFI